MASPISRSHFLVILLLACFTVEVLGSSSARKHNIIPQTCKRLAVGNPKFSYAFCVKTFLSNPRSRTANLEGLGLIAFQRMFHSINHSFSYINKLRWKLPDLRNAEALQKCNIIYKTAQFNFKQLLKEYKQKDYKRVVFLTKAVLISPSKCKSQFRTRRTFKKRKAKVSQISVLALSIVRLLAKQH